jgi:hypothetical protein
MKFWLSVDSRGPRGVFGYVCLNPEPFVERFMEAQLSSLRSAFLKCAARRFLKYLWRKHDFSATLKGGGAMCGVNQGHGSLFNQAPLTREAHSGAISSK